MGLPEPYYQTDLGTLYCGDCLEIMPHLPKVDLVLTDPPYNISGQSKVHYKMNKGITEINYSWDDFDIENIKTILKPLHTGSTIIFIDNKE